MDHSPADPINHVTYFHATYSDHPHPDLGRDLTFLDTRGIEGAQVWSGHFVGMSWVFSRAGILTTLEGDPRFFFDDSQTPQGWGTGTEEWGGGGDYWGGRNMTLPLAGHPVGKEKKRAQSDRDLVNSAYRFLIADLFPFGRRAVINLEHGGVNQSTEHYSGVVYWYGVDAPMLILTDEINACHEASRNAHRFSSPTAEPPYDLVSRYEWGPDGDGTEWGRIDDADPVRQFFPAQADKARILKGAAQFTVTLERRNLGVLLRRKFDYQYLNQRARVWVRPADGGERAEWQDAGEWYTAGANTCVYSNPNPPKESGIDRELAPAEHHVITSNRRWREEEFLIARRFTDGLDRLEIKFEFVPNPKELFPGRSFPAPSAWSEARYWIYCYRLPDIDLGRH